MNLQTWLSDHRSRLLEELLDFIRAPSVSTDPGYADGIAAAAEILRARLERIGMRDVQLLDGGGHKAVYGAWLGAPEAPTLLVYGHYDVQPPDLVELWHSPPFEPTITDGRIVARGASDDKSPLWIAVSAAEAWLATAGSLPVNVKFLLEGEEEIGSRTLPVILDRYRDLLAADVLISADGGRWRPGRPSVNVNSRGNLSMETTVRTAARTCTPAATAAPSLTPRPFLRAYWRRCTTSIIESPSAASTTGYARRVTRTSPAWRHSALMRTRSSPKWHVRLSGTEIRHRTIQKSHAEAYAEPPLSRGHLRRGAVP